jgi:hypothetical protein
VERIPAFVKSGVRVGYLRRSSVKIVKWMASVSLLQNPGLWLAAPTLYKHTRAERGIALFFFQAFIIERLRNYNTRLYKTYINFKTIFNL